MIIRHVIFVFVYIELSKSINLYTLIFIRVLIELFFRSPVTKGLVPLSLTIRDIHGIMELNVLTIYRYRINLFNINKKWKYS